MPIPPNFAYPRGQHPESFDAFASVIVASGAGAVQLTSFQAPGNIKRGYVTLFGHGIDNVTAWVSSVWSIRRNGAGVLYYARIQDQLAEFTDPKEIGPIVFGAGDIIDVVVEQTSGAPHLYAARLRGFLDF